MRKNIHWRRLCLYLIFIVCAAIVFPIVIGLLGIPFHGLIPGIIMGIVWGLVGTALVGGSVWKREQ